MDTPASGSTGDPKVPEKSKRKDDWWVHKGRAYTFVDMVRDSGLHLRTVQGWHRDGMKAIDETDKPLLFMGEEILRYRKEKKQRRCIGKLKPNEFKCGTCKCARLAKPDSIIVKLLGKAGKGGVPQTIVKAACSVCGKKLSRISTVSSREFPATGADTIWELE